MKYLIQHFLTETFEDKKDLVAVQQGNQLFKYKEIDERANNYQAFFLKSGVKKVGILSRVRVEAICAMIGALNSNVVYIPLNTLAPASWIGNICKKAQLDMILVDSAFYETACELKKYGIKSIVLIDDDKSKNETPLADTRLDEIQSYSISRNKQTELKQRLADDIAYVLYTSGSTGDPKGILITHRNAFTFIDWMTKEFKLTTSDRIFSRAPLQFDLSVFDIFSTFQSGATLVIAPIGFSNKPKEIVSLMQDEKISMVYTVPSAFISWMSRGELDKGIPSLRQVMYAGEPFPVPYLRRFIKCLPDTRISNIYGPTETNIVTYFHIENLEHFDTVTKELNSVPIGKPVHDTEIYVVDQSGNRAKTNEVGEILVRGGTVFAGYMNDPVLTSEKLIQSPFQNYPTLCCKTGDLGRFLDDGNIVYHGRADSLIKTRGYRVEIGEIESAMSSIDGINELAVVAKPHKKYGNSLHAFVSVKNESLTVEEITRQLAKKIPSYMVPFKINSMDSLPRTSTGKIDRVKLTNLVSEESTN